MKALTKRIFALAGVLALGLTFARAQSDGALLDALVKKGVLTDQEAEDIRADEAKDFASTPAGKFVLSDSIQQIRLYGDVRYRYEYLDESPQFQNPPGAHGENPRDVDLDRYRFRVRIGTDVTFADNFTGGIELETNTAADSANQTMGAEGEKFGINVGLAYLQWKPTDWLTLMGGKFHNPLYTTDLVWDPDINPEGGAEVLNWTIPIGGSSAPVSTDPKAIAVPSEPSEEALTIGLTAYQGDYSNNASYLQQTSSATGGNLQNATDVWQFVEQVPVQFNFDKSTFIKEVPGFDSYTSGGNFGNQAGVTAAADGGGQENFTGPAIADHLEIFLAPGEFDWKLWDIPFKVYWDFALNTDGKARVQDVLLGNGQNGISQTLASQQQNRDLGDNVAWLAGLQVGQNKKKGDWSIRGDFRQTGLGSVDPNENDSDFAGSYLNQQGVKVQSIYNFTDFLTGSVTVYDTWAYKNGLFNGATPGQVPTGLPLAGGGGGYTVNSSVASTTPGTVQANSLTTGNLVGLHSETRLQVDLSWKF